MEISQLIPHVEALIFAADRPLPVADILELLNNAMAFLEDRATQEQVEAALEAIQEKYNSEFYAFSVRESGGGYQFLTKKEYYQTVAQLNGEKFLKRLSTAALETLAIIAYKQPISKGEIEHIRGVSTDYSITKLLEKELIVISGRSEELPGKPLLYTTSKAFMDYFGLNSPKDLPKLKEVFDEDFVAPTQLSIESGETLRVDEELVDDDGHLIVSETGELTETTTIMMDDEITEESDGLEQGSEAAMEGEAPLAAGEEQEMPAEVADNDEEIAGDTEMNEADAAEGIEAAVEDLGNEEGDHETSERETDNNDDDADSDTDGESEGAVEGEDKGNDEDSGVVEGGDDESVDDDEEEDDEDEESDEDDDVVNGSDDGAADGEEEAEDDEEDEEEDEDEDDDDEDEEDEDDDDDDDEDEDEEDDEAADDDEEDEDNDDEDEDNDDDGSRKGSDDNNSQ
ncbi:SMC-Scp complex subunit ScpB [Chitinophaga sp. XS-30]|uniref:SMC-Scp complex subunit ScpB n=1 Tax=Chitinophaga sp. XS-30 TaxID=2604421 RepID=UPI0011DD5E94|nr:SMC-Scp complex subunit ScpB [Chitinophaga sp. XS-30]QEH43859.1 SMC-Scp complex subunit ScpB [Chitinophaga sp. XS-30]